jgi:hypothetical protein
MIEKVENNSKITRLFTEHGCVCMLAGPLAAGQHRFLDFNFLVSCQCSLLTSHSKTTLHNASHFHPAIG